MINLTGLHNSFESLLIMLSDFGINKSSIMGFILGLVAALISDYIKHIIYSLKKSIKYWLAKRKYGKSIKYNPKQDGLYEINKWSLARPLNECTLKTIIKEDRPEQNYIENEDWEKYLKRANENNYSGSVCYITGFSIDFKESDQTKYFKMQITPCGYQEHMATSFYLKENVNVLDEIKNLLDKDVGEYVRHALPSSIAINVAVVSPKGNFLAMKRSSVVDTAKGIWTVGPYETMTLPAEIMAGSKTENIFSLAERCLREEVGLEREHYETINISWIGILAPIVRGHVVAQVVVNITEEEVQKLFGNAHSNVETECIEWIPLNRREIVEYVNCDSGPIKNDGREWINQAKLTFSEIYRNWDVINKN